MALEIEGYSVRQAQHGVRALEEVAQSLPDLIILDLKMPVMSGEDFAVEFRRQYGPEIPILIITAADDATERIKATGESRVLPKPFDLPVLLSMVEEILA
jgi:CheY-like chemotaxis protein